MYSLDDFHYDLLYTVYKLNKYIPVFIQSSVRHIGFRVSEIQKLCLRLKLVET